MTDKTTTEDINYEEEAQGLAEAAERLAEQHKIDTQTPDEPAIKQYPIYGADHDDTTLELTLLVGPEVTETVSVPWPDDTQDMSEPLVRLAEWKGISLNNITNMETVPVRTDGEEYELIVPPENETFEQRLFLRAPWLFKNYVDEGGRWSSSVETRLRPAALGVTSLVTAGIAVFLGTLVVPLLQTGSAPSILSVTTALIMATTVFTALTLYFAVGAADRFLTVR